MHISVKICQWQFPMHSTGNREDKKNCSEIRPLFWKIRTQFGWGCVPSRNFSSAPFEFMRPNFRPVGVIGTYAKFGNRKRIGSHTGAEGRTSPTNTGPAPCSQVIAFKDLVYLSRPTTRTAIQPDLAGSNLVAEKPVIESKFQLWPGPTDLQFTVENWKLGGWHMLMFDWSALMTPRRQPWTEIVHFGDSYPIDVSHLSINFLCLPLL